ncbi:EcsC family protein [Chitinophaga rhizophila]|uniref:EcsC family protein n=1 Tax=Chitinophaga rhizophila TaxID=2866212 RepID=A0ABS7GCT5_9BACT|nr:EcsC family protein [Chitinophaga rhizophila]MBW8685095.1 EcsC family protein [Chitinophaga rhizophila]
MDVYLQQVKKELRTWQKAMQRGISLPGRLSRGVQRKINRVIPEKVHRAMTTAIKQMTRGVISGAGFISPPPVYEHDLAVREARVKSRITFYKTTAATEGALTGAGGILLGLADFPLFLTIKMKMLFDIAALYGKDVDDYRERLFILHIFFITFSTQDFRNRLYPAIADWDNYSKDLPDDINAFDWRNFQQQYRDYLDLAKLLQLMPVIGAAVGAYVNHRLTDKLGQSAMNAYRLRLMKQL